MILIGNWLLLTTRILILLLFHNFITTKDRPKWFLSLKNPGVRYPPKIIKRSFPKKSWSNRINPTNSKALRCKKHNYAPLMFRVKDSKTYKNFKILISITLNDSHGNRFNKEISVIGKYNHLSSIRPKYLKVVAVMIFLWKTKKISMLLL